MCVCCSIAIARLLWHSDIELWIRATANVCFFSLLFSSCPASLITEWVNSSQWNVINHETNRRPNCMWSILSCAIFFKSVVCHHYGYEWHKFSFDEHGHNFMVSSISLSHCICCCCCCFKCCWFIFRLWFHTTQPSETSNQTQFTER